MIVVAIIGMLAAIAIPNLMKGRENGARTTCHSNQKTIRTIVQQWAVDKKKGNSSTPTDDDLKGYFEGEKIPACPAGGKYNLGAPGRNGEPSCSLEEHGCYIHKYLGTYINSESSKLILESEGKAELSGPSVKVQSGIWEVKNGKVILALEDLYTIGDDVDLRGPDGSIWKKQ